MRRTSIALAAVLIASGCAKSEDPAPSGSPSGSAQTARAVAEASAAAAAETPPAFAQCKVCHSTEKGTNLVGPSLAGVAGRKAGSVPGFAYSAAMKGSGLTWDAASLDTFLTSPMATVPGTRMTFAGIKDPDQRKAVVAYLETLR